MVCRNLIILIVYLPSIASTALHDGCESYRSMNSFRGLYCPIEGIIIPNLAWHQCKLVCLQTSSCQAVNYDFTASLCIHFAATCPQALNHPGMAFGLFTGRQPHECLEWISVGSFSRDRLVTMDTARFVARLQKDGNNLGGYYYELQNGCLARDDDGWIFPHNGHPCQCLRVRDGCTVYYTNYEIGSPVPPNTVMSGYSATGVPIYLGRVGKDLGYYIAGSNNLMTYTRIYTGNVMLLVLVWRWLFFETWDKLKIEDCVASTKFWYYRCDGP